MDLDWVTLYDYMTLSSRKKLYQKINQFYEEFYPLKLKNNKRKKIQMKPIQRGGLLGIIAFYIERVLTSIKLYLEAQFFLTEGQVKDLIKLYKLFIEIENQNLHASLALEEVVLNIQEGYLYFTDKNHEKSKFHKKFFQIKLLCSLKRLFQFYYHLNDIKEMVEPEGYNKIYSILRLNSMEVFEKAKVHFKLYPQIQQLMVEILRFFSTDEKQPFFFNHFFTDNDNNKGSKKVFNEKVRKFFTVIPNKQKQIFINLSDENFVDFLQEAGVQIPKDLAQSYLRSEEQINSIIAEEQKFLESIVVPQIYRGKPEWKKAVVQQMLNLSLEINQSQGARTLPNKFKFSDDYPIQ